VKLYPEIILKAANNNKNVGAFKLWILAKSYDRGCGAIPAKRFRRYTFHQLGIPRASFYRMLKAALELQLITYDGDFYHLAAWDKGAMISGVAKLIRPVYMPLDDFINKGWLSNVWKAFVRHFAGRNISRAALQELTGVPARTQREYESQAGVKTTACFADMGDPSKDPENAFAIEGAFYGGWDGHTRRRISNRYEAPQEPDGYYLANKGNTRRRNRKLEESQTVGGIQKTTYEERIYCEDAKQLKQAKKQNRKADAKTRPDILYLFRFRTRSGKGVFSAVPA